MYLHRQHDITFSLPTDETILTIQEDILRGLANKLEISSFEHIQRLHERNQERYFLRAKSPGFFQLLRLLEIPDDYDFLHVCYKALLRREPDAGGLQTWWNALMIERQSRVTILVGILDSDEFRSLKDSWKHTERMAGVLLKISRRPVIAALTRGIWLLCTQAERNRMEQLSRLEISNRVKQLEKKVFEIENKLFDEIEFVHNIAQIRKKSQEAKTSASQIK